MGKPTTALTMSPASRAMLESWIQSEATSPRVVIRARICLLAADGVANRSIATRLGIMRPTVLQWRRRFAEAGPAGIAKDAPHGPSSRKLPEEAVRSIMEATLRTKPPRGAKRWSTRSLAKKMGVGHMTIARIWNAHGLPSPRGQTAQPISARPLNGKRDRRAAQPDSGRDTTPGVLAGNGPQECIDNNGTTRSKAQEPATTVSRARQTYEMLRARIAALPIDAQLPAVAAIRTELGVSQDTVAKALAQLESQGLIERNHRKGIFVANRLATGEIAIVMSENYLGPNASPTYARQCSLLRQELHEVNPKWSVNLHLGVSTVPGHEMPATLDLLDPAVLPRLRGVLTFHPLLEVGDKLREAGVPVVCFGAGLDACPGVAMAMERMLRDGIRHLADVGCRNVALLHAKYVGKKPFGRDRTPVAAAAAAECGLAFRDEWFGYEEGGWGERCGYELFIRIWDKTDRPDGVMVDDDVLCRGVLQAIQELRLEMPRDLRLVTHASRGIDLPYPRPVTRMEFDLHDIADKAVRMLEKLIKGKTLKNSIELVQSTLVKGATT